MPATEMVSLKTVDVVLVDSVPPVPANRPQTGSLSPTVPARIAALRLPPEYEFVGGHEVSTTQGAAAFFRSSESNALLHVGLVPLDSVIKEPGGRGQVPTTGTQIAAQTAGNIEVALVRSYLLRDGKPASDRPTSRVFVEKADSVVMLTGTLMADGELLSIASQI